MFLDRFMAILVKTFSEIVKTVSQSYQKVDIRKGLSISYPWYAQVFLEIMRSWYMTILGYHNDRLGHLPPAQ